MIWGGGGNREKKISEALLQEKQNSKKFKNASLRTKKKIVKRPSAGRKRFGEAVAKNKFIFEFSSAPRSLMVDPLACLLIYHVQFIIGGFLPSGSTP